MHKIALILALILVAQSSFAGWRTVTGTPKHTSWRFEDIHFANDRDGWLVNMSGDVFKTSDGGESWLKQVTLPGRLRSVEFLNDKIGIIGSISEHSVYRTENGGQTWVPVDHTGQFFRGVCGLSHIGNTFYGVGRFANSSYFYKSTDTGITWNRMDLSHLAISLVDVNFLNEREGYITGHGARPGQGAVLLRTTDGGATWNIHYESNNSLDYHVWKIKQVTSSFVVGSIWSNNSTSPAYFIRSRDGWRTFTRHQVSPSYFYVEGIGFYNERLGWMGGGEGLWETQDGGDTWKHIPVGSNINQFVRLGKKLFAVGKEVYVYEPK